MSRPTRTPQCDGEQGYSRNERQDNGDQSRSRKEKDTIIILYLLKFFRLFLFFVLLVFACIVLTLMNKGKTRPTSMV